MRKHNLNLIRSEKSPRACVRPVPETQVLRGDGCKLPFLLVAFMTLSISFSRCRAVRCRGAAVVVVVVVVVEDLDGFLTEGLDDVGIGGDVEH